MWSKQVETELTYDPTNPLIGLYPEDMNTIYQRFLHHHVFTSNGHHSQKLELIKMFIMRWTDKENTVCKYTQWKTIQVLKKRRKKETRNPTVCSKRTSTGVEWNKPDPERQMPRSSLYLGAEIWTNKRLRGRTICVSALFQIQFQKTHFISSSHQSIAKTVRLPQF